MEANAAVNYEVQDKVFRLVQEHPQWAAYLEAMVGWELEHPPQSQYDGWLWHDVQSPTSIINSLVVMGLVKVVSQSRAYTHYRLRSLPDTREGLDMVRLDEPVEKPVDVDGLFSLVVGHDRAKMLLTYSLKADEPVHCLLLGPVGTAKTLMLSDIGRLPGAEYYVGSTTTKAGLVGLLLMTRPRYLVIDEIDKMAEVDRTPLLNLMETGMVSRLQHRVQERLSLRTKVFAGANDVRRISSPILSRFAKIEIPPYTPQEFVQVAQAVLVQREDQGPEMALHIAQEVVKYSTDIRDAVRVARMARKDPMRVMEIVRCLWPGRPPLPPPLMPVRRLR